MSRIGKLAITIPSGVQVNIQDLKVDISGPKGTLSKTFKGEISVSVIDNLIKVDSLSNNRHSKAMRGTARSIINGMVEGVEKGFAKKMIIDGVGYRASVNDGFLKVIIGKSHSTVFEIPEGITVKNIKQNLLLVEGINKQVVGQFAADLRKEKPPEPYKGKGIRCEGDHINTKVGKKN